MGNLNNHESRDSLSNINTGNSQSMNRSLDILSKLEKHIININEKVNAIEAKAVHMTEDMNQIKMNDTVRTSDTLDELIHGLAD